ncbi:MAG: cyanoexosortase B system-associated protein [Trichodesmium sp. ALOHA_ZT_67]|nr:cyanoexosortase B system-associated protein [Trichodesmium sp. ALOHA_ZT_67]
MLYPFNKLQKHQFPQVILVLFLLIILVVGTLPGYIAGKWSWENTASIPYLKSLRQIRKDGLTISGLPIIYRQQLIISNHKWLLQKVKNDTREIVFLLLTPNGPKDKPQVEWMDISGLNRWKIDSQKTVKFTLKTVEDDNGTTEIKKQYPNIKARFFRGWTSEQTYAIMQWYAWPGGGSPKPRDWFWADRFAMASKKRMPWVAVSIIFPIEPLTDIDPYLPELISIGQKTQASLIKNAFK